MPLKLWNYNLVDQGTAIITATNENALFPVLNLKDPRRTKVFRSTTNSTVILFDFLTTQEVDSIVITPHSKNGFGFVAPITIEANPTNTWGSPAFSTTIASGDIDQIHEIAIKEFAEQNFRFWRVSISGASYVELSNIFIGKMLLIGTGRTFSYDWQYVQAELSQFVVNRYGQRFSDIIDTQKRISASINLLTKEEIDDFFQMYDYNRTVRPFYMKIESAAGILNNENRLSGMFYFDEMPFVSNPSHALWNMSATLSEAK
jgi:aspartyl/asparaginyl-tRNA synthetase